jgi:hypothetical protein
VFYVELAFGNGLMNQIVSNLQAPALGLEVARVEHCNAVDMVIEDLPGDSFGRSGVQSEFGDDA